MGEIGGKKGSYAEKQGIQHELGLVSKAQRDETQFLGVEMDNRSIEQISGYYDGRSGQSGIGDVHRLRERVMQGKK